MLGGAQLITLKTSLLSPTTLFLKMFQLVKHYRSTLSGTQASRGHSLLLCIHLNVGFVVFHVCVCACVYVCFTCYFSMILMALQSARHFNRARERLVKHTHTHHKTGKRSWHSGTWWSGGSQCASVRALSESARVMVTHDEGKRETSPEWKTGSVCLRLCVGRVGV